MELAHVKLFLLSVTVLVTLSNEIKASVLDRNHTTDQLLRNFRSPRACPPQTPNSTNAIPRGMTFCSSHTDCPTTMLCCPQGYHFECKRPIKLMNSQTYAIDQSKLTIDGISLAQVIRDMSTMPSDEQWENIIKGYGDKLGTKALQTWFSISAQILSGLGGQIPEVGGIFSAATGRIFKAVAYFCVDAPSAQQQMTALINSITAEAISQFKTELMRESLSGIYNVYKSWLDLRKTSPTPYSPQVRASIFDHFGNICDFIDDSVPSFIHDANGHLSPAGLPFFFMAATLRIEATLDFLADPRLALDPENFQSQYTLLYGKIHDWHDTVNTVLDSYMSTLGGDNLKIWMTINRLSAYGHAMFTTSYRKFFTINTNVTKIQSRISHELYLPSTVAYSRQKIVDGLATRGTAPTSMYLEGYRYSLTTSSFSYLGYDATSTVHACAGTVKGRQYSTSFSNSVNMDQSSPNVGSDLENLITEIHVCGNPVTNNQIPLSYLGLRNMRGQLSEIGFSQTCNIPRTEFGTTVAYDPVAIPGFFVNSIVSYGTIGGDVGRSCNDIFFASVSLNAVVFRHLSSLEAIPVLSDRNVGVELDFSILFSAGQPSVQSHFLMGKIITTNTPYQGHVFNFFSALPTGTMLKVYGIIGPKMCELKGGHIVAADFDTGDTASLSHPHVTGRTRSFKLKATYAVDAVYNMYMYQSVHAIESVAGMNTIQIYCSDPTEPIDVAGITIIAQ